MYSIKFDKIPTKSFFCRTPLSRSRANNRTARRENEEHYGMLSDVQLLLAAAAGYLFFNLCVKGIKVRSTRNPIPFSSREKRRRFGKPEERNAPRRFLPRAPRSVARPSPRKGRAHSPTGFERIVILLPYHSTFSPRFFFSEIKPLCPYA